MCLAVSSLPALHFLPADEPHTQAALALKHPNLLTAENVRFWAPPTEPGVHWVWGHLRICISKF